MAKFDHDLVAQLEKAEQMAQFRFGLIAPAFLDNM